MPIHTENFDSVTAPANPSGWVFSSGMTTTTSPPGGVTPTSSPNALEAATNLTFRGIFATYGTPDSNSGNVSVQCSFNGCGAAKSAFSVLVRGSASTLSSGTTQYQLTLAVNAATPSFALEAIVSGTPTVLATITPTSTSNTDWYQVRIVPSGPLIQGVVKDLTTGNWLDSSGNWQPTSQTAISVTDSSITGSGYTGFILANQFTSVVADDWILDNTASPVTGSIAATEGPDTGTIAGKVTGTAILTKLEGPDTASFLGVYKAPGHSAATEGADTSVMLVGALSGHTAASERPDTGTVAGHVSFPATIAATEGRDTGSIAGVFRRGALLVATEGADTSVMPAVFTAQARTMATEGADTSVMHGVSTRVVVSAATEGHDTSVFLAMAFPVPPGMKYQERPDFGSIIGLVSSGGYNVYSNSGTGDPIDYTHAIATVDTTTWTSSTLAAPGTWKFGVRAFNANGEEQNLDCSVTIVLDANGNDISNIPIPPSGLRAFSTAGGGIRVEWLFTQLGGLKQPTGFNVYSGVGTTPDYRTPVATATYPSILGGAFQVNLSGLIDGTKYAIGVRAFNGSGEEKNVIVVTAFSDSTGPSRVSGLTGTAIV